MSHYGASRRAGQRAGGGQAEPPDRDPNLYTTTQNRPRKDRALLVYMNEFLVYTNIQQIRNQHNNHRGAPEARPVVFIAYLLNIGIHQKIICTKNRSVRSGPIFGGGV